MNRDNLPLLLAMTTTVGFLSLLWLLCFHEIPPSSHDLLLAMVGTVGGAWNMIVGYYFGSSAGSAKKTELMAAPEKSQE